MLIQEPNVVNTVPADVSLSNGAGPSAGTVLTTTLCLPMSHYLMVLGHQQVRCSLQHCACRCLTIKWCWTISRYGAHYNTVPADVSLSNGAGPSAGTVLTTTLCLPMSHSLMVLGHQQVRCSLNTVPADVSLSNGAGPSAGTVLTTTLCLPMSHSLMVLGHQQVRCSLQHCACRCLTI